ncbi:AAA family ATPase [Candidatus Bathyarchaeota archaeon]|nr:AAA family ATPase [Candidatus Bathyarchaeota archaeon]
MGFHQNQVQRLKEELKARFVGGEEILDTLVLNQLHRRSTTLIRAPRGTGKSTLMLLVLRGLCGDDMVVISGASEVKRGEVIGRLHIPSLEKNGVERVLWAAFTKARGKGLDEVNRLNPYTTANIHHMMQFGEVWAYGQRAQVGDYVIVANENPMDPTTFIHPPPFYDRFDICVFLRSLTLREKFRLQSLLEKYEGEIVSSMPQVISQEELEAIRKEVQEVELSPELMGAINIIIRDFQVCIRGRDQSELKPPALCDGCHFTREVCSRLKEPPSERAVVVLTELAKAKTWLEGKCEVEDLLEMALWVLPHRTTLVNVRSMVGDLRDLLNRERAKMSDREVRREWPILNRLYKEFDRALYQHAKEIAMEDMVFAEELRALEEVWIQEGRLRKDETVGAIVDWK